MTDRPIRIAIVAGEASGDAQGAALLRELARLVPDRPIESWGIGSRQLADVGTRIIRDCAQYSSIGVVSTLAGLPTILAALADMKRMLAATPPDVLICIDSGGFNVRLARWVKRRGICPVFYYFPPGSWRKNRRPGRGALADVTDLIVTPFPWSETLLRAEGANVRFVGHPLLDLVRPTLTADEFCDRFGLDRRNPLIALLPGSRPMEIKTILPAMIGAAGEIAKRMPTAQFAVALAPTVQRGLVEEIIRREQRPGGSGASLHLLMQAGDRLAQIAQTTLAPTPLATTPEGITVPAPPTPDDDAPLRPKAPAHAPVVICEGLTHDVLARCDFAITKSGTSTLEAAILQKPMVVVYRGSGLMEIEWALRKSSLKIDYISMPNILAGEMLVPELIQENATAETISAATLGILLDPARLIQLKSRLADLIKESLGEPGGIHRSAELLLGLIEERKAVRQ